jgi:drug/metabolite transporter (DMT)-like permease
VAILGIALVSGAYQPERLDPIGLAAAAVASLTFAGYLLVGEHLGRSLPVLTVSAYGFAFSALILLLVTDLRLPPAEPLRWLQLLWILVMGTVVPFLLEVKALQLADPGAVGVAASLEPVVGTLVAWVWLGQTLTLTQALGAALTVGRITAIQRVVARSAPLI